MALKEPELMTNEHLYNFINYQIKKLEIAKKIVNEEKSDNFSKIYYRNSLASIYNAEEFIREFDEIIMPYVYEAFKRNLDITALSIKLQNIVDKPKIAVEYLENIKEDNYE